jgi:4-hydroxyphenylpyruvate dioxygenase-like putative hemolysin
MLYCCCCCPACVNQTYLEQNEGPGLQHLALKTNDIIHTVGEMAKRSQYGGFEFMPRPSEGYYGRVADKVVSRRQGQKEEGGGGLVQPVWRL